MNRLKILKFLFIIGLFSFVLGAQASTYEEYPEKKEDTVVIKYDTIIKLGGKKIICTVLNIRTAKIYYYKPNNSTTKLEINRKQVEKIIYKSGKVEVFNKPLVMIVDENQWEAVVVTDDASMVESMFKRGTVSAESGASSRNLKAAKRSTTIKIQKRAANLGANVVLITRSEAKGGYGDFPSYEMEGVAYSFEPPKPGEEGSEGDKK